MFLKQTESPGEMSDYLISNKSSRPLLGPTQPPIQWVSWDLAPRGEWPECEFDWSSHWSVEFEWSCIPITQHVSMACICEPCIFTVL